MTAASSRPLQRRQGGCHCGAVRFAIPRDCPQLTPCNGSICRRKHALMVKVRDTVGAGMASQPLRGC